MAELDADVIIAGVHFEQYLVRLSRVESLSHPGSEVTFTFSADFPHFDILPWDTLVVYEQGVKTLTGYVQNIIPQRGPATIEVKGQDTFIRALNWFLPENLFTSGSQNIGYWVNYLCGQAGLSYQINDSSGSNIYLNADIQFGLRSVADALVTLCGVAQWTMLVDVNGILQFNHVGYPSSPEFNLTQAESFEFERNDLDTRNRVIVWGWQETTGSGGSILYSASRTVDGIPDTRNMVFAEPNIVTNTQAAILGEAALDQWAKLESVIAIEAIGNPNIRSGDALALYSGQFTSGSYLDTVTDMESVLDQNGYNQNITAGRRAYRYPYWPVGGIVGSGQPTIDWEYESVIGEARDLYMLPGRNLIFVGGYTHKGHSSGSSRCWRLEARNLSTGSLVWAEETLDVENGDTPSSSTTIAINGVYADSSGVYVTGVDRIKFSSTAANRWRTQRHNLTGGSETWMYPYPTPGAPGAAVARTGWAIEGDGQSVYVSGDMEIGQITELLKIDHDGNVLLDVAPVRLFTDPALGTFTDRISDTRHLTMLSNGLLIPGTWNKGTFISPQKFPYLSKYTTGYSKLWEEYVWTNALTRFGSQNSMTKATYGGSGFMYALSSSSFNSPSSQFGGLNWLTSAGDDVDFDASVAGTNMADGGGFNLFLLNTHGSNTIMCYAKESESMRWQITYSGTRNGIRYLGYAGKLYVCGQKNNNFYVARYGV